MATYIELNNLRGDPNASVLRQKISVAIAIKANALAKLPTPTTAQKDWAKVALANPENYNGILLNYILADNAVAAVGAITGATDEQVQTAVDAAVDTLLSV
jgi:hypothetical protein